MVAMRTMPVSEAKDRLSALVESVQDTHETVTITRHGKAAAVLISSEELESLRETLMWLSDPGHRSEITEAEADIASGQTMTPAELREHLDRE